MRKVRVLLVDDNETFLKAAALALKSLRGVQVADKVTSGADALAAAHNLAPDLVLLDFNMPHMNGIETAWRLRGLGYSGKIVLMSLADEGEIRERRSNIEADAFIDKRHFVDGIANVVERLFPRSAGCNCCA